MMVKLWPLVISFVSGFSSLFFLHLLRKLFKYFYIKSFRFNGFKILRFSPTLSDLRASHILKRPLDFNYVINFKGHFFLEITGFNFKISCLKVSLNIESFYVYINSNFLRNYSTTTTSNTKKQRFASLCSLIQCFYRLSNIS